MLKQGTRVELDCGDRGTIGKVSEPYPAPGYHLVRFDDGSASAVHESRFRVVAR